MSGFDEWFSKFENTDLDSYDIGYLAWNEKQKKIDAVLEYLNQDIHPLDLSVDHIKELLKCGKT